MDWISRSLCRRPASPLLLLGLVAAALVGTLLPWGGAEPCPTATAAPPDASPSPPAAQAPAPLPIDPAARWLLDLDDRTRSILSTGCPMGEANDLFIAAAPPVEQGGPLLGDASTTDDSTATTQHDPDQDTLAGAPATAQPLDQQGATAAAPGVTPEHPSRTMDPPAGGRVAAGGEPSLEPAVTRLPAAAERPTRSPALEAIADEADRHSRRAFELAGRNAWFAARAEFILALRLVAQGLDREAQAERHERALIAGLIALRESDDFIAQGARLETALPVQQIVRGHQTPVLKQASGITPLEALQKYLTFAQQQFAAAAQQEVAGSMALHGLGKLHATLAAQKNAAVLAAESKAVSCYQAALLVCPRNFLASNDLGVLLARCGRPAEARLALEHSLSLQRTASAWQNLATVYGQLSLHDKAQQAWQLMQRQQRIEELARTGHATPGGQVVHWVDSKRFAETYAASAADLPTRSPATARPATTPAAQSAARAAAPWTHDSPSSARK